jgi:hypothetical protein
VGSHAHCALSSPFSEQCEKAKENRQDAILLKKIHFFFNPYIGISAVFRRFFVSSMDHRALSQLRLLNHYLAVAATGLEFKVACQGSYPNIA